jgi:hypothetical protein
MRKSAVHNWRSDSDMATLAAIARTTESPGLNYFRAHAKPQEREKKDIARSWVVRLFSPTKWPESLSIFTLPGVLWRLEKSLLRLREPARVQGVIRRTFITSIEREAPLYAAALKFIPGADQGITHLPGDHAKMVCSLRTPLISRFHCGTFEDFAEVNNKRFGAAWLDFTGPLSPRLLETIPLFWNSIRRTMVVTFLDARWCAEVGRKLLRAGGPTQLLHGLLPQATLFNEHRYVDKVPMLQLTFNREMLA